MRTFLWCSFWYLSEDEHQTKMRNMYLVFGDAETEAETEREREKECEWKKSIENDWMDFPCIELRWFQLNSSLYCRQRSMYTFDDY